MLNGYLFSPLSRALAMAWVTPHICPNCTWLNPLSLRSERRRFAIPLWSINYGQRFAGVAIMNSFFLSRLNDLHATSLTPRQNTS
jgi:hypothetical protein